MSYVLVSSMSNLADRGVMSAVLATRRAEHWKELERAVARRVEAALTADGEDRSIFLAHLGDLEAFARAQCDRRETIQVLASGRRLLGDRSEIGPIDGPFAHSLGAAL